MKTAASLRKRILIQAMVWAGLLLVLDECPSAPGANPPGNPANGEYVLTDFGDVATPEAIQKTLDKACEEIRAKGGGTLVIPPTIPQSVPIYNRSQTDRILGDQKPAVTILDRRAGYDRELVAPIGRWSTATWAGKEISRMVNIEGPGSSLWGTTFPLSIRNQVVHGTSSYQHPAASAATAGKDRRVYLHTVRGIFVGQPLNYYFGPLYASGCEQIVVKSIGWDSEKKTCFLTADLTKDHATGGYLSNKNMAGSLSIEATLNADSQTAGELSVVRRQYAHGDSFLISSMYIYQGDVLTQQGDEAGMAYNAEIEQDPDPFHSTVESVDWSKDEIVFAPGPCNIEKLASSRPLINMNPKKWITEGTVLVVGADNWSGFLVQDKSFDLDTAVRDGINLSQFPMIRTAKDDAEFAAKGWVDLPYYEPIYKHKKVIPNIVNWDGNPIRKFRFPYQGRAYPSLIAKGVNRLGGRIIASANCGWTPDVVGRYFAISDDGETLNPGDKTSGQSYMSSDVTHKVCRWYPIIDFWKNADGTCGIRLGRVRMFAGGAGAPNFYNEDNYTWDGHERPLRYIIAPGAMVYDVSEGWKDAYGGAATKTDPRKIRVVQTPDRGGKFDFATGDPVELAIGADPVLPNAFRVRLWNNVPDNMPDGNGTISLGNNGRVSATAGIVLYGAGDAREDIFNRKDRKPPFLHAMMVKVLTDAAITFDADVMDSAIRFSQPHDREQPIKWMHAKGESTLAVDPLSGDMHIRGSDLGVSAVKEVHGISSTSVAASNLRGIDVVVPKGAKELRVRYEKAEADAKYSLNVQPNWMTQDAVTEKTIEGFKVVFSTPAADGAKLDWQLIR